MAFWNWIEPFLFDVVRGGMVIVPFTTVLFAFITSAISDAGSN